MALSIDSEAWMGGENNGVIQTDIIDFLETHPDTTYTLREIAEEVADTQWIERDED